MYPFSWACLKELIMEYQSLTHILHGFGRKITQFLEEAGLICLASSQTVGSKFTRNISPRLIEVVTDHSLKLLVDPANLRCGFPVFDCKPSRPLIPENTFYGRGDETTSLPGLYFPRKPFKEILGKTDVDSKTLCAALVCFLLHNNGKYSFFQFHS